MHFTRAAVLSYRQTQAAEGLRSGNIRTSSRFDRFHTSFGTTELAVVPNEALLSRRIYQAVLFAYMVETERAVISSLAVRICLYSLFHG